MNLLALTDLQIPQRDVDSLRRLGERLAAIGQLPVQEERAEAWRRLNDLDPVRPMVWINEIPWHEMNVHDELTLTTTHPFAREVETTLRRTLYQWEHMQGDMIVEPVFYAPLEIQDTGFGVVEESDKVRLEPDAVASRHFHAQIRDERDLERIQTPIVTHDEETTERRYEALCRIFDGVLQVEKCGLAGMWFAPWDELVTWWGVQEALMDLVLRPELVHAAMERLITAHLARLDQLEAQGLLSLNNRNVRVGSGGYGYTQSLPRPGFDPDHVRAQDLWGCATAQILGSVSPAMHEEFAIRYERRWLERFGLAYYGCCEPLHEKIDILRQIPNLRKISISPWADPARAAEQIGLDYVISYKPSPAILATDVWDPKLARQQLRQALEAMRGCAVEVIMKDISTVRHEPQRLWEWAQIAAEEVERVA